MYVQAEEHTVTQLTICKRDGYTGPNICIRGINVIIGIVGQIYDNDGQRFDVSRARIISPRLDTVHACKYCVILLPSPKRPLKIYTSVTIGPLNIARYLCRTPFRGRACCVANQFFRTPMSGYRNYGLFYRGIPIAAFTEDNYRVISLIIHAHVLQPVAPK